MRRVAWVLVWGLSLLLAAPAWAQPEVDALRVYLGTSGSTCTLHSGSGAPSTSLGAVCDVYVRTDSPYTVYTKTGASTWSEVYRQGGTDVAVADGGTGVSSWTSGDLVYASGSTTLAGIADVGAGSVLVSNSGAPGWASSPTVTGTLTADTSVSTPTLTHSANLTLSPTGDVVMGPTGNDILPSSGYTKNLGALTNKYLTLHAAELWVETLVAQNTIATIGGRVLVGPTTTLTSDLGSGATSIEVKHNQMASGDRVYLEADGKVEFVAITSGPSGGGPYTYSVTRNLDGTGANDWYAGDAVFNTGTTGDGFIDLYSVSAVNGPSVLGPAIVGNVRTGTTYSDIAPRWAIGNLNGVYGYSADTYGAAFGDFANSYLTVDATNGIRMIGDAGTMFSMDTAGNATFAGRLTVGTGRNLLGNTEFRTESSTGFGTSVGNTSSTIGPQTGVEGARPSGANNRYWLGTFYNGTGSPSWEFSCNNVTYPGGAAGGGCAFYEYAGGGVPSASSVKDISGPAFAASAGQYYEFSFSNVTSSPISSVCALLAFYDSSGTFISTVGGNTCSTTNPGGGGTLATWNRVWGYGVAPTNTMTVLPLIRATYDGTDANSAIFFTRMYFGEAGPAQTTPTPWAPGGITTVDGAMLQTDLVISNTIRSSGATALGTGTGFWLDATGTPTFRVGDPSGDRVEWDSNLTIQSADVIMDGSGIAITANDADAYSAAKSYKFTATNLEAGLSYASYSGSSKMRLRNRYTGGAASRSEIIDITSSGQNSYSAYMTLLASDAASQANINAFNGSVVLQGSPGTTGNIILGAVTNVGGAISTAADGKVVCIKSDNSLGTCNATTITTSGCTCS